MVRLVVVVAAAMAASGCAVCREGYLGDRFRDLTDAAHVEVSRYSWGALAAAGPLLLGCESYPPELGAPTFRLGLGGVRRVSTAANGDVAWGLGVPIAQPRTYGRPTGYGLTTPAWGSFRLRLALHYGLGAEVDVVELVDFLLGWFGVDLLDDDLS